MSFSITDSESTNKLHIYISFFLGQGVILIPPLYYLKIKKEPRCAMCRPSNDENEHRCETEMFATNEQNEPRCAMFRP